MAKKIKKVRENLINMGDSLKDIYDDKKDLNAARNAIRAYNEATRTAIAQVHYKRLSGSPGKIDFLEE